MSKIAIDKTSVFSVLHDISEKLGGHYMEGVGEALMKVDNENAIGAIGACELIGGISCLSYNITYHDEMIVHIVEEEDRHLYLTYILKGYFHYKIGESNEFKKAGGHQNMITEVYPKQTTVLKFPKGVQLKYLAINVDNSQNNPHFTNQIKTLSEELATVFSTAKKGAFYEYKGNYSLDILRAIDELYDIEQEGAVGRILKEGAVRKILGFQLAEHENNISGKTKYGLSNTDFETLQGTITYIENHLAQKHSVKALAEISGMTEKKLQLGFQKLFQKNTIAFIKELRLEKSRELLLDSEMSVKEIAYELGFANASYYTSLFRKRFEATPRAYRAMAQNQ